MRKIFEIQECLECLESLELLSSIPTSSNDPTDRASPNSLLCVSTPLVHSFPSRKIPKGNEFPISTVNSLLHHQLWPIKVSTLSSQNYSEHLKQKIQGCFHDSADECFSAITDVMEYLEKPFLHSVFDEWISHLHLVVESGGDYIQT
jgi:hypothetical protein